MIPTSPHTSASNSSSVKSTSAPSKAIPSLFKAASLIAGVTLLSKLLGAVRDWQILTLFGANLGSDAYFAALQLPSFALILLGGLGGPFHTATVSIFSRLLGQHKVISDTPEEVVPVSPREHLGLPPGAQQLARSFITLSGLVFCLIALLVYVFADPIMHLILQKAQPGLIRQAAHQLQIMSPIIFMGGIIGIFYGLLNVFHQFFWPSFSPALLSLLMVVVLGVGSAMGLPLSADTLAWSTLVGVALMFVCQLPDLFRLGLPLCPRLSLQHPDLKGLMEMLFPAIIGTSMGQLNVYVDMFFTASLPLGGWTAIIMGNRLIQLPLGVLQTALLVPVFPRFTQQVAAQDWQDLRETFRLAVVSLWLVSMPILVFLIWFSESVIRLFFQHGKFDARATHMVATVVLALAASIPAYFTRDTLTRVFYAFQDAKTPLWVGGFAILTNAVLDAALVGPFGVAGIALSTSLVTTINMVLLMILVRKFQHSLGLKALLLPFGQIVGAAFVMGLLIWRLEVNLAPVLLRMLPKSRVGELAEMAIIGGTGFLAYLGMVFALRLPEASKVTRRLLKR